MKKKLIILGSAIICIIIVIASIYIINERKIQDSISTSNEVCAEEKIQSIYGMAKWIKSCEINKICIDNESKNNIIEKYKKIIDGYDEECKLSILSKIIFVNYVFDLHFERDFKKELGEYYDDDNKLYYHYKLSNSSGLVTESLADRYEEEVEATISVFSLLDYSGIDMSTTLEGLKNFYVNNPNSDENKEYKMNITYVFDSNEKLSDLDLSIVHNDFFEMYNEYLSEIKDESYVFSLSDLDWKTVINMCKKNSIDTSEFEKIAEKWTTDELTKNEDLFTVNYTETYPIFLMMGFWPIMQNENNEIINNVELCKKFSNTYDDYYKNFFISYLE